MIDYTKAKIYKIVNDYNEIIYIGSTAQTLARRMVGHRTYAKKQASPFHIAMNKIGIEKFKILLVKSFPCNSKAELEAEEFKIMKELKTNGVELYNEYIGCHSQQTKTKMSLNSAKVQKGKFAEEHISFNHGCINYDISNNRYRFRWYENNTCKAKSFACNKYGIHQALELAIDTRKKKYPDWLTPEEEAIVELGNIEL